MNEEEAMKAELSWKLPRLSIASWCHHSQLFLFRMESYGKLSITYWNRGVMYNINYTVIVWAVL